MITAVVAVRKGSQRVPNKNIKPFGDSNLLEMKLKLLSEVDGIDEIIVNSDCDKMLDIGKQYGAKTHKRDEYFASSKATNSEFHRNIAETTDTDVIFLAPVCAPFVTIESHQDAIDYYCGGFDSVTSVTEVKSHLWLDGEPLNYDLSKVPNSQDLPDVVKLTYGISIIDKEVMYHKGGLVGNTPGFIKLSEKESMDIDTEFEWQIAEIIYKKNKENK
jgi:CMP-N-acetylneuraminic acid synthetase